MSNIDLKALGDKLSDAARKQEAGVHITRYELAILLAAYKQLDYQNNRRGTRDVVKVTETDQNPE